MRTPVTVCFFGTYNSNYARTSALRQGLCEAGVRVVEVNEDLPNLRMELPEDYTVVTTLKRLSRKALLYVKLMRRYDEVKRADVVFVLHPGHLDIPFAWVLCKLFGKPLIFDDSISPYDTMFVARSIAQRNSFKAKIVRYGEQFLLRFADRTFVDTLRMKAFLVEKIGVPQEKIFVVPLGANDKMYKPAVKKRTNKPLEVLFFGLYNVMHGTDYIMQAIKLLKSNTSVRFTLIGDGHLKDSLIAYAKKHKLTNVDFVGFMPEAELVKRIQGSDIMLGVFSNSPLFKRVIPNKVFAAIACRKALITARLRPVEDYLTHEEDVYYCEPEDAKSLAQAISRVSADKTLRETLATNAYRTYKAHFSPKKIGEKLIEEIV